MTTSTRIVLTSAQRALLGAVADVTDEIGTASLALAAERVKRRAPDVRNDAAVLLRLGLVDRLQPDVVMLGRGWTTLGRMPRPRLGSPAAAPPPVEPQVAIVAPDPEPMIAAPDPEPMIAAPDPEPTIAASEPSDAVPKTAKAAMLAYALAATRPVSAREIANAIGAPVPTVKVTLRSLARKGRLAHCIIEGAAHYSAPNQPDASSAGTDPAGDAGPGAVAPLPAVDGQAREGSACGDDDASRPMEAGGVDEALKGAPVEGIGGGAWAAADASASLPPMVAFWDTAKRYAATRIGVDPDRVSDRVKFFEVRGDDGLLLTVDPHLSVAAKRGAVECNVDVHGNYGEAIERALAGLEAAHAWQPPPVPTREIEVVDLDLIVYEAPKVDRRLRVYVATGLEHAGRARLAHQVLQALGHEITYDWTTHGSVQGEGADRLREVAACEMEGVVKADLVIAILPGGRGTHVEIGAAIGAGVPVMILEQVGAYGAECAFYSHPAAARRMWETVSDLARHIADGPAWAASVGRMTAEVRLLRLELEEHVGALDEVRATLTDVGITPTAVTDTGSTTTLSTPTMAHMAAHELRRTHAQSGAAMRALQRIATAAGLPGGIELKHRDVEELVEHITERLAADPPSGTTVRTILDAVSEASGYLLDWHRDDGAMVAQLPALAEHLRRQAAAAREHEAATRHGGGVAEMSAARLLEYAGALRAQAGPRRSCDPIELALFLEELAHGAPARIIPDAYLQPLLAMLAEYEVAVDGETPAAPVLLEAIRRALHAAFDHGVAKATTDGIVGELLARCQDYVELARELRAVPSPLPEVAAAVAALEQRRQVIADAVDVVRAEVARA